MAIFNMIGGGDSGSSGAWTRKFSSQILNQYFIPQQDSSEYFGYFTDDYAYAIPAYRCYATGTNYGVVYWTGTSGQEIETSTISSSLWQQSSTSYSGMSPTPTKAPSASGSVYYFNMPPTTNGINEETTWAWVYDSSSNWMSLYQWEEGSSGSSDKNTQTSQVSNKTSSTSLASVNSITCSTTGSYNVYWTCSRTSTSSTSSYYSQLYINGTAYGSAQTTWYDHVQIVQLTGVPIEANDVVAVYVKTRGTNYYGYCPQLTIVQT